MLHFTMRGHGLDETPVYSEETTILRAAMALKLCSLYRPVTRLPYGFIGTFENAAEGETTIVITKKGAAS